MHLGYLLTFWNLAMLHFQLRSGLTKQNIMQYKYISVTEAILRTFTLLSMYPFDCPSSSSLLKKIHTVIQAVTIMKIQYNQTNIKVFIPSKEIHLF